MCTHVSRCKNDTCSNYFRNGEEEIKNYGGGAEFKYDILDILQELL
jgi:hypothetical protein